VDDVGRFDPVEDHVYDGDDVSEGLLFFAVKGAFLENLELAGAKPSLFVEELE
jgi:hypothetical protein